MVCLFLPLLLFLVCLHFLICVCLCVCVTALSEGNYRDGYYKEKREKFPPENEREPGKDYSEGAKIYNLATPIK